MRTDLILCDARGRFLFELRPDLFPEGGMTDVERELWDKYYEDKAARLNIRG